MDMEVWIKLNSMEDAAKLVNRLEKYDCHADAYLGSLVINAKSIMGLLGYGIGRVLRLWIDTEPEEELWAALDEFMVA